MKKVSGPRVIGSARASEMPLPAEIQEALGELVGAAREGLLALSVGLGLRIVHELMGAEVTEVVGPKGKHNRERTAKRHGHERGSMTLGGRRVEVSRPRIRTADDERELPVSSYEYFADRDPLTRAVMDRMLAGVSTRKFVRVGEPVGEEVEQHASSTSKSTVSELFIEKTRVGLERLMGRRLDDVRLAVMMLDGLEIAGRVHVVALGITTDGVKIPLGLWEGSTENATLARELLGDLVDRGLDPEQAILFVLDGGKALRKAIKEVFGERALVHRCQRHKERNVCDLLPESDRPKVLARIRGAWALSDAAEAEQRLERLASELERTWPDAASSLREGMSETLTLMRLGVDGQLAKTLASTNPIESMIEIVRRTQRNVKALAGRRHAQALDRRRDARRRAAVPPDRRLQRPRQARGSDRTTPPHPHQPNHNRIDQRHQVRRRTRYRLTVTVTGGIAVKVPRRSGQPQDDDAMADRWAALLANASGWPGRVPPSFPSILRDMSPPEAALLDGIYNDSHTADGVPLPHHDVSVGYLESSLDTDQRAVAVDNLIRLGLCVPKRPTTPGGVGEVRTSVMLTDLGRALVTQCRAPTAAGD